VLVIANDFSCFRPDRKHAVRVEAIQTFARSGIVWLGIACSPVDQIELRVVGTGTPRRPPAVHPRIAVLGPRFRSRLAWRWNGIPSPQLLAGIRIPSVEESARRGLTAGHTGNQHAVCDDRRARRVETFLGVGELLVPKLLAGLHV